MKRSKNSIRIGKLFGIDIELHFSWFIIVALLSYGLSIDFFPGKYPGLSEGEYWGLGIASALLLFASVLFHEISHSLVAKKYNIGVEKINLFFFGGVAQIHPKQMKPKEELYMALAGPVFSVLFGLLFYIIYKTVDWVYLQAISSYLFRINWILAAFNMVPGFPLDGGRVFRAILWMKLKDFRKATEIATNGGKMFAFFLMATGGVFIFSGNMGGIWLIFLGLFLYAVATLSYEQIIIKDLLANVKVKQIMDTTPATISPSLTLDKMFEKYFLHKSDISYIVASGKKLVGVVNLNNIMLVPKQLWPKTKVSSVAVKPKTVNVNTNAYKLITTMGEEKVMGVFDGKKFVGVISSDLILHFIRVKLRVKQARAYISQHR